MESQPRYGEQTLSAFVEHLASAEPVPGGGSASAIAGALGAGLVAMVAALSEGRPRYVDHAALYAAVGPAGRALADRLLALADEDAAAYATFIAALKLPKATDADRLVREAALRRAARAATLAPLAAVEACRELVVLAEVLAGRSNANASSDVNVAALLGDAAARGAAANVRANLPAVGDEPWAAAIEARVQRLLEEVTAVASATRAAVAAAAPRPALPPEAVALLVEALGQPGLRGESPA